MAERSDYQRRHTAASLQDAYMPDKPKPEETQVRNATPAQITRFLRAHGWTVDSVRNLPPTRAERRREGS